MGRILAIIWILTTVWMVSVSFSQHKYLSRAEFYKIRQEQINTKQGLLQRQRMTKAAPSSALQNHFDAKYYKLNLKINPTTEQVSGFMEMRAKVNNDNFKTVELDLFSNMQVDSVSGDAENFSHSDHVLQIQLAQALKIGDFFTIQVAYHGQPSSSGFGSFGINYHLGTTIIWTLSEPYFARSWWPCKDTPGDKADSVDIMVTVPDELLAVSNGLLVSNIDNGDGTRTFHWHESYPITTYLISLAITNYAQFSEWFHYTANDSMEVQYYVYPEDLSKAKNNLTETLDMLAYFHQIFGPYPFIREKYGIAQFPWGGGMEHQTITSQGGFGTTLTVHELAHQWFGDKITNANWHEIWLNEGFASYAEALYFEHKNGEQYFHNYMTTMDRQFPYPIWVEDTTSVQRIFHNTVYDKGAWFLHMLRHIVGDSTFFDILLEYSMEPRFAYKNATTAGFQNVCETVSGKDLDWFFQPWIYEAGRPVYQVEWTVEDSTNNPILNFRIKQIQYPAQALFPMPIDVTIKTAYGDTVITIFNDSADQKFQIPLKAYPTAVVLDEKGWILKTVESVTLLSEFTLSQNYPNPFNGNTTIEFSLPAKSYVELKIYNIKGQLVRTLAEKTYDAGNHQETWNGRDKFGNRGASGLYIYQLRAGDIRRQKKLVFIK